VIVPSPLLTKIGLSAALYLGLFAVGYWQGYEHRDRSAAEEMAKVNAVAAATNARYRSLEQEASQCPIRLCRSIQANRDATRADWLRIQADAVSVECPRYVPSPEALTPIPGHGMEDSRGAGNRDLLKSLVDALKTGEALEAGLALCQQELRQCAGLR
jgi:hypothetical protein